MSQSSSNRNTGPRPTPVKAPNTSGAVSKIIEHAPAAPESDASSTTLLASPAPQDSQILIRAKARDWELTGWPYTPPAATNISHQSSFVVSLPPGPLPLVGGNNEDYFDRFKRRVLEAYDEYHETPDSACDTHPSQIPWLLAVWGNLNDGGSYTVVKGDNIAEVLRMVIAASPWSYVVFDLKELWRWTRPPWAWQYYENGG